MKLEMEIRDNILPVLGPKGGEEEVEAIREVIESGWWGKGPKVAQFEEQFAEMLGRKIGLISGPKTPGRKPGE